MKEPADIADDPFVRKLAWKSVLTLLISFFVVMALGYFLHEPVAFYATQALALLGPLGIFLGVLGADAFGLPIPPSTYLFAAVASGAPALMVLTIAGAASLLGGSIAYFLGPYIGRLPILRGILERFRPRGERLFRRWGSWTILVAALTPLPFAPFCWLAGIYKMPFKSFFSAAVVRAPRLLAYYAFFTLGWSSAIAA